MLRCMFHWNECTREICFEKSQSERSRIFIKGLFNSPKDFFCETDILFVILNLQPMRSCLFKLNPLLWVETLEWVGLVRGDPWAEGWIQWFAEISSNPIFLWFFDQCLRQEVREWGLIYTKHNYGRIIAFPMQASQKISQLPLLQLSFISCAISLIPSPQGSTWP